MYISPELLQKLVQKYGPNINITAEPWVLQNILNDINSTIPNRQSGYRKTYYKENEDGGVPYHRYDRTIDEMIMSSPIPYSQPGPYPQPIPYSQHSSYSQPIP
ncbi:hypothetical protein, partial [Bacillus thuringiensis]|uniref:hypothetical protein n=1 Tax=Bacillus thuringiensis TaxID=1428 RepID=UPI000C036DF2